MAKLLLDNLMKVFALRIQVTGSTLISGELDLDIPRGYVIRIHDATIEVLDLHEDFQAVSADKIASIDTCLIKDPDDITSISIPTGRVDHDVLMSHRNEVLIVAGTAGDTIADFGRKKTSRNFSSEGLDVITARNLRLNCQGSGTDSADLTESRVECIIHYTLEKITDADILALLDII